MSFGSLKTLKLERTLGDAVLSITKHVPTDMDEVKAFIELDNSIIEAAMSLSPYTSQEIPPVISNKAESNYPAITSAPVKAKVEVKEEKVKEAPKRSTKRGRPAKVKEEVTEEVATDKPNVTIAKREPVTLATQDEKTSLVQTFQETFEAEIGYTNEDTYMDEFNTFITSLISMDYKTLLEADITKAQLKTFKELI